MSRPCWLARTALWLLVTTGPLAAHPGGHGVAEQHDSSPTGSRVWTLALGEFHEHGSFVMADDERVQIRRDDGSLTDLKLDWLSDGDRIWVRQRRAEIERINRPPTAPQIGPFRLAQNTPQAADNRRSSSPAPTIARHFRPFEQSLELTWDDQFLYVGSNGMPDHRMMVGITAWQQQVPLPQSYFGRNAWRIPLHPRPAANPMSAKTNFFRGAIALAVNGVPIFNPIKNDGRTDTLLAGELDEFGGHCGRADDYHYHIAPVHLEPAVGVGQPIAYALDGYPIYGYTEADGAVAAGLDWLNGHKDAGGNYHYHATRTYPYLNGGFYGEVTERDGQVDPQPTANGVRPALPPLRGAKITGFSQDEAGRNFTLDYELSGQQRHVRYSIDDNRSVTFTFDNGPGRVTTEIYDARAQRERPRPQGNREPPPRQPPQPRPGPRAEAAPPDPAAGEAPRSAGPRGPQPGDGPRQPWLLVHGKEMDSNQDGVLTREEVLAEARQSFAGYDSNQDHRLLESEYHGPSTVRSAMGGFIRQHAKELDRDQDGVITLDEVISNAGRMFDRVDADGDRQITTQELEAVRRTDDGPRAQTPPAGSPPAPEPTPVPAAPGRRSPERDGAPGPRPNAEPQRGPRGRNGGDNAGRSGSQLGNYTVPPPANNVPKQSYDIILGRPTDRSITARILAYEPLEACLVYGTQTEALTRRTPQQSLVAGEPADFVLESLTPDTRYFYRFEYRRPGASDSQVSDEHTFHTQRRPDAEFTFTLQADSHLDENTSREVYEQTLANALNDSPDFHIELGDTFMTNKYQRYQDALAQYLAQRYYFGRLCHSAPLFFTLGNHDGESGERLNGSAENMTVWSALTRNRYFPNPQPDSFYTGNTHADPFVGPVRDYYAWEWGNALFVVLDPFWYTVKRRGGTGDNWQQTLGREQYEWLRQTLAESDARFKFVFVHHLVGGADRNARGGIEAAPYFEWGGRELDGRLTFAEHRPGWEAPIHDLLVKHGVSIVFHGHDHMFVHQELDGVTYQLVPQPGYPREGNTRSAASYGYVNGYIEGSPGHVRVRVTGAAVRVDYIRTCLPDQESPPRRNGDVSHSYEVTPPHKTAPP